MGLFDYLCATHLRIGLFFPDFIRPVDHRLAFIILALPKEMMMSTTPIARTRNANTTLQIAQFRRNARKHYVRVFTSIILTTALLAQVLVIGPIETARARDIVRTPAGRSAPVSLPSSSPTTPIATYELSSFATTYISSASDFLFGKKLPVGFEAVSQPNAVSRLGTALISLLGLAAPAAKTRSAVVSHAALSVGRAAPFDFDGDSKADFGRWRSSSTEMKVASGGSYLVYTLGSSSSINAPGDFNGDGHFDAGVFNAGTWTYKTSTGGSAQTISSVGQSGDIPMPAYYDADSITDAATFRPTTGTWTIRSSKTSTTSSYTWGQGGDIPVVGDFDGDGVADTGIYRPSLGLWSIQKSSGGLPISVAYGNATDIPVPGDYEGDGKADIADYRPSEGTWYVLTSSSGFTNSLTPVGWGSYGDQPVPADYDGDAITDYAVFRPTSGTWYIKNSSYGVNPNIAEFSYFSLGAPGDIAVSSSKIKQIGATIPGYSMATVRTSPANATGSTDLYSQNFNWGTSLVNLPGRAGLDLNFGMSYNSLVWIKYGTTMYFEPDKSNVSPGFRLGFPVIEPVYYDSAKSKWVYLMMAPSGARIEFRQISASNSYETGDSTYAKLTTAGAASPNDPVENITIKVTTTDGTQMSYAWLSGAFRCTEIKDRNGNFITIGYDYLGLPETITDTLGRVLFINYDSGLYPTSIAQMWKSSNGQGTGTTHTWASFAYVNKTLHPSFSGLTNMGPPDGTVLKVLEKINYSDGSYTKFTYNDWGQVGLVENYADDDHVLNHVKTNLYSTSGGQTDCPRVTDTYNLTDKFNLDQYDIPQETHVNSPAPSSTPFTSPDGTETAKVVKVTMDSHPTSNYYR